MRVLLIANPVSGRRAAEPRRRRLEAILTERGHEVVSRVTRAPGDAARIAADLGADADRLVVVGGDGTLNEVLNGLGEHVSTPIAQLPTGTANLLGHEFHLPRRPERVADLVERGVVRKLDAGEIDGHRFLLLASCGFDAMVTRAVAERRSGALGYRGWLRPIYETLRDYREPSLRVRLDGGEALPAAQVVVSNVRNYGGLFSVTERASAESGHLDVCVFARFPRARFARYAASAFRARISRLPEVRYETAREIEIEADAPVPVEADGDYWGETPVAIRVIPGAVPLLTPNSAGPRSR